MDLKTDEIISYFKLISDIPRCSGNEENLRTFLVNWFSNQGLDHKIDNAGNLIVNVPATPGYENKMPVIIQGHLDMVCEKTIGSDHNFSKDPIHFHQAGEWITAKDTTLGADNGIGIALMLALVSDNTLSHPELELLFTVEEETGFGGAYALNSDFFRGKKFISLDSEKDGIITIGSAGGQGLTLLMKGRLKSLPDRDQQKFYEISVTGLTGGHSGLDINKNRGNAITILAQVLISIIGYHNSELISFEGGSQLNAIPRSAKAVVSFSPSASVEIKNIVHGIQSKIKASLSGTDKLFSLMIKQRKEAIDAELNSGLINKTISRMTRFFNINYKISKKCISTDDFEKMMTLLTEIPNGVEKMSSEFSGSVETSSNIGNTVIKNGIMTIRVFIRSAKNEGLERIKNKFMGLSKTFNAKVNESFLFEPWEPRLTSALLLQSVRVYKKVFQVDPIISIIHGGLECGIIEKKINGIDIISIGPTIENAHTPDERLHIKSVKKVWIFLTALLADMK